MSVATSFDAEVIVVGAGHNGLICAAYLAKKWQLGFCENAFSEDSELESELCDFQDPDLAAECREQFEAIRDICLS